MDSVSLTNGLSLLADYIGLVETMASTLEVLTKDISLAAEGWRIHYAVDFAEVYAYAHKTAHERIVGEIPGEEQEERFVRGQVALGYLFSSAFERLVLLPSYLLELRDHLNLLRASVFDDSLRLQNRLKVGVKESLQGSPLFATMIHIAERHRRGESLAREDYQSVAKFAANYFKDAYVWITMNESGDAARLMIDLIRTRKLQPAAEYFPGVQYPIETLTDRAEEFYDRIFYHRGHTRSYQSYMDALACSYVEYLNSIINPRREYLVLVTHSDHTKRAMDEFGGVRLQQGNVEVPYIRDLDYFLTHLTHSGDNLEKAPSAVANSRAIVERFQQIRDRAKELEGKVTGVTDGSANASVIDDAVDVLTHAQAIIRELKLRINSKENLEMILRQERGGLLEHAKSVQLISQGREDRVVRFLVKILSEDRAAVEEVRLETGRVSEQISESLRSLYEVFRFGSLSKQELERISKFTSVTRDEVLLRGIRGEAPLRLRFGHSEVRESARLFERVRVEDPSGTKKLRERLIGIAADTKGGSPEIQTLLAYVMCSVGDWEIGLSELDRGLAQLRPGAVERDELVFLKCLILRKLERCRQAFDVCYEGLREKKQKDARLSREMAVIIWQSLAEEEVREHICTRLRKEVSLDLAIMYALQAERARGEGYIDRFLYGQILNTLAYLYAEKGLKGDLTKSEEYLKQLARVIPEKEWIGRFYDTQGLLYLARAKGEETPGNRRVLLEAAVRDFARALGDGGIMGKERMVIEKHLAEAKELSGRFGSTG